MKNILNKITLIITVAGLTVATACSGFLDTVPTDSISSENVWQSATLAESAVNGVYNELYYHFSSNYSHSVFGAPYDGFSSVMDLYSKWREIIFTTAGALTASNDHVARVMRMWYTLVYRANDVINNIDSVPDMDDDLKSQYKAECLFLRAYAYSLMNYFWGGIPLYLENVDNEDSTLPRSSAEEVWEQVIADLTECINSTMPDKYSAGDADFGRITKGAAYAFRGQAYQVLEDWESALADFEAVEDCGYSLYSPSSGAAGNDDFLQLFFEANEQCNEIIFSVQCEELTGHGNTRAKSYGSRVAGVSGWNVYVPNPGYVEEMFENADGSTFDWEDYIPGYTTMTPAERSVYFLRDGLVSGNGQFGSKSYSTLYENMVSDGADMSKYIDEGINDDTEYGTSNEARIRAVYENRDPRLMLSIITPYSTFDGYESATGEQTFTMRWPYILDTGEPYDIRSDTPALFVYLWRKYVPTGNTQSSQQWLYPGDIYLCRYAEVLLRRAECLNELGRTDEAVTYVNMVRKRCGHVLLNDSDYPATVVSGQDDMRERIRREFYAELGGEDSMYQNELRWGTWFDRAFYSHTGGVIGELDSNGQQEIWGENVYYTVCVGEHVKLWPIPSTERERNPNLTQNPGYED